MRKINDFVLHHRRLVLLGWLILTIIGFAAAGPASKALDQRFSVPGREGWDTNEQILRTYGSGGESAPLVAVVKLPEGTTASAPAVRAQLRALEDKVDGGSRGLRVAGYGSTGDRAFVSKDGRTTFVYAFTPRSDNAFGGNPDAEKAVRKALVGVQVAGQPVHLTGYDALFDASGEDSGGTGVLLEAVLGGLGALIVLVFVFGSALAFVPLLMAISSVLVTFLLLWGLTAITEVSPVVQFLVALIGLGVSIDYALLIVVRWREEHEKGLDNEHAVAAAMETAGRAVVFSGTTVAIGLLALIALPLPFLRSVGYGGMLIPLVATFAALTLLPAILAGVGPRLDKHRIRRRDRSTAAWSRWSAFVVRHRIASIVVALAILGALLVSATNLHLGNADPNTIAKSGDAKDGLVVIQDSDIGSGALAPVETLVPAAEAAKVTAAEAAVDGVHGAVAPGGPQWRRAGDALVVAVPVNGDDSKAGRDTVQAVRDAAHEASGQARVGGTGPVNADFIDAVYGSFPLMILLIALATFVLLARAFRSILLPIKAILLNVLSVGAAWGVLALVWQYGHGSDEIWGISATGSIASWVPLMVFAFLYGLSMDYEVFILARMREEYDETKDTNKAVITGLGRTGRLVTSAALILFLAFVSMASGPGTDTKILATGLAAGILLDATVIRALLVPAVVSLMGKWNWWLPDGMARLLRVSPSPRAATETGGGGEAPPRRAGGPPPPATLRGVGLLDSILGSIRMDDPVRGTAQIVSVSSYDGEATWQNCRMHLVVQADGVPATPVEHHAIVAAAKWPWPGQTVPVVVDRGNPQRLKIDWDTVEDSSSRAARSAEELAAQLRGEGAPAGAAPGIFGGATVINLSGHAPTEEQMAKLRMLGIDPGQIATTPPTAAEGDHDVVDELSRLADLHKSGALTDAEFAQAKKRILEGL
jgi:RND superfamily putative drug exporter